jgi:TM2 domain-containing membrane protein YozV
MIVSIISILAALYFLAGLLFVFPFLIKGLKKIDAGAHGSGSGFRLIIIPGIIVLWPFLLMKWMKIKKINDDKAAS